MSDENKDGIEPPNYTQIPNLFLDELLPKIKSMAELKVILAIARKTFGYHKKADQLSLSQIVELTGLSRESVSEGIKHALDRGILRRKARGNSFIYGLKISESLVKNSDQSRIPTSQEFRPELVKNSDHLDGFASQESSHTKERVLKENNKESTPFDKSKVSRKQKSEKQKSDRPPIPRNHPVVLALCRHSGIDLTAHSTQKAQRIQTFKTAQGFIADGVTPEKIDECVGRLRRVWPFNDGSPIPPEKLAAQYHPIMNLPESENGSRKQSRADAAAEQLAELRAARAVAQAAIAAENGGCGVGVG